MTIEQKLMRDNGTTLDSTLAVWMLKDGTMVNGSKEGRQRDVDHHEICEYFTRSKKEIPGSSYTYVEKFMRRGNLRMGCSECGAVIEAFGTPTRKQMDEISKIMASAMKNGIDTCIGIVRSHRDTEYMRYPQYLRRLSRYCTKIKLTWQEEMIAMEAV